MSEVKIRGIVLDSLNYEENDKIITVYSDEFGKLSFIALGANKASSKNNYSLNVFSESDFEIFKSRKTQSISKLKTGILVRDNFKIAKSYNNYLFASIISSVILQEELFYNKDFKLFDMLREAIRNINDEVNPFSNMVWFLFYSLKNFGGYWELNKCYRCNKASKIYRKFDLQHYGLVCPNCINENEEEHDYEFIKYLQRMDNNTFFTIQKFPINVSFEIIISKLLLSYYLNEIGIYSYPMNEILKKEVYKDDSFWEYTHKVLTKNSI
ncbi:MULTISPECIES: DNA repair protein RecO [Mesoplasma]|uniref:DNA repair protein RecO n=1 Tax=Mesoplasma florum TaxID=2151 RepID=A0A2R3P781_MESFO|nr:MULTISPECIES: DNA repair protein RecO [Mesoplasma]AVN63632.1 DNA repair protein RecO [Mesoplasma florum]AVN64321.1 DNA repair protein RecO [Mesoplasma florum]